ncbi:hypothetical protein HHK36_019373 [Tetracentron sinense]|uniref:TF-B3 domain-containing protein n=1 Tax=Tetracentron sinense TaxID=13715 RepID=A0A834YW53_TETSI|nr:hypothetical protein HHK36_019373 [Tetracentron sinense]
MSLPSKQTFKEDCSGQNTPKPKNPSSKHNGVVPQIYGNHHRFWVGTFETQEPAVISYVRSPSMSPSGDATLNYPNQDRNADEEDGEEREHLFEKPLTPSDVGKLNRLVIPKQHAEKYFPLGGDSVEKGLILSFDDESGKSWRFRYSYWNSSQSYVLTKGWSRFVKEKRLHAGDVVRFERHRLDGDRTFIRWRRRASPVQDNRVAPSEAWTRVFYSAQPYPSHPHGPLYQSDCLRPVEPVAQNQTPAGNCKRLRLFGVNLDCELDGSEPPRTDGSYLSSQGRAHCVYSQAHGTNHDY